MDEYIVEIDELDDDIVVVVAPALCLLVFGRTLDEALYQARASIGYRLRETAPGLIPSSQCGGDDRSIGVRAGPGTAPRT
jgi:hypothetical protein